MTDPAFNRDLDAFCAKYMFSNRPVSLVDQAALPGRVRAQNKALFEQLLLFDTVVFKVTGENVPLAMLISQIGLKGVEQLVEERALKFVLWRQDILAFTQSTPGIHPLGTSNFDSPAHADPEKSADLGLNFLRNEISGQRRRRLIAKIAPLYEPQPDDLARDAVALANSAYTSGRLAAYGLRAEESLLENFPTAKIAIFQKCAVELLECKLLIKKNWSSISSFTFFDFISESVRRLTRASAVTEGFQRLAYLAQMPDLPVLFANIEAPLQAIPRIRAKRSSIKFRKWMAAGGDESPYELTRRYVEAIGNSKGFFERGAGKFVKSVAMTAVGAGVGAAIEGGLPGTIGGMAAGKALDPLADLGLDLLDTYLLEGLLSGWTPKLFFSDIKAEASKVSSARL